MIWLLAQGSEVAGGWAGLLLSRSLSLSLSPTLGQ